MGNETGEGGEAAGSGPVYRYKTADASSSNATFQNTLIVINIFTGLSKLA